MNNPPRELEGLKLKFYEKVQLKNAFEEDYVRGAAPAAHSLRRGGRPLLRTSTPADWGLSN